MNAALEFVRLSFVLARRRVLWLTAFGALFLISGSAARVLTGGEHGHVELDPIFAIGGTTLVSAVLLLGWLVGRFPLIAILVLMSGFFGDDRAAGYTRLYAVRPRSLVLLYGARFLLFALIAFGMSALLLPAFDIIVLGEWGGADVFVLMTAQIIVFGALTAFLSTILRGDAWAALFLGIIAMLWDAMRRADFLASTATPIRELISVALPPQGALLRIETAFGASQPVPWDAFLYVLIYAALILLLAGVSLHRRSI